MNSVVKILFEDEVMLAGWRDSHNSGATVTFWVGDSDKLAAFRGLTIKKGNTAGQRLGMVLVEINDDETLVVQPEPAKGKLGPLALLAVQWCEDPRFQLWLADKLDHSAGMTGVINTAHNLKTALGIKSRRELDADEDAAHRFQALIRAPYMDYLANKT